MSEKKFVPLFPPYLDAGSSGAAVDALHIILCSIGFDKSLVRDFDYGDMTVKNVKKLQKYLGFQGDDVDGNLGPNTRKGLLGKTGISVNSIPISDSCSSTTNWLGPDGKGGIWPPEE